MCVTRCDVNRRGSAFGRGTGVSCKDLKVRGVVARLVLEEGLRHRDTRVADKVDAAPIVLDVADSVSVKVGEEDAVVVGVDVKDSGLNVAP